MRTKVDLPDSVFRRAKAAAALEGKSLKAFLLDAVSHELERQTKTGPNRDRVKLPLIRSKRPGSLRLTSGMVADALAAEETDVPT